MEPSATTDTAPIDPPKWFIDNLVKAVLWPDIVAFKRIADTEYGDVNHVHNRQTLLQFTCQQAELCMVPLLLERGANVGGLSPDGDTALHHLIARSRDPFLYKSIQAMLQHGASVKTRGRGGRTALHLAVLLASSAVVQLLLDHGASISTEDDNGHNSMHCAGWRRVSSMAVKKRIVSILLEHPACAQHKINILTTCAREELIDNNWDPIGANGYPADLAGGNARADMMRASLAENIEVRDSLVAARNAKIEIARMKRCVAFDMGTHPRLGKDSVLLGIPPEVMKLILKNV